MLALLIALAVPQSIDTAVAARCFAEAAALSERDGKALWGRELYGPMLLVDPQSRAAVANRADAEGKLEKQGDVYVGKVPGDLPTANTATRWAGTLWTMILWPLPLDPTDRGRLMAHELYHRIQDELGLRGGNPPNGHLDAMEGRILLQLEWRALAEALGTAERPQLTALKDALVFRARRRELYPGAAREEQSLEINEGLAEYTGVKLSASTEPRARERAIAGLNGAPHLPTFVRSFAYETGPAYGLLLDALVPGWRRSLHGDDDLAIVLQRAIAFDQPDDLEGEVAQRSEAYDGQALRAAEEAREKQRRAVAAKYRALLVDGPVLELPLTAEMRYSFDPNEQVPFEGYGTVYPTMQATDQWGTITVRGGALLSGDGKRLVVTAPAGAGDRAARDRSWSLELKPGWTLSAGKRASDFVVTRP